MLYSTATRIRFWTLPLLLVLAACDANDPDEAPTLKVAFVQAQEVDYMPVPVEPLKTFELPPPEPLPIDSILVASFTLDGYDGGVGFRGGQHPDEGSEVIFLFVTDDRTGDVVYSSVVNTHVRPPAEWTAPAEKSVASRGEPFQGTLHVFSVESIGTPSRTPIEVSLRGTSEEATFTFDPNRHKLPARYVLHVDETTVVPRLPKAEAPLIAVTVQAEGFDLMDTRWMYAVHQPTRAIGTVNGKPVTGHVPLWHGSNLADTHFHRTGDPNTLGTHFHIGMVPDLPDTYDFYLINLSR